MHSRSLPILTRSTSAAKWATPRVKFAKGKSCKRNVDLTLSKEDYFRVIEMKTGALFAAATSLAAAVSGLGESDQASLAAYGMKLGTAYQIYDDCLDLVGLEEVVGKTLGTDLAKGKLTLPILNLLESVSESQRDVINKRILDELEIDLPALVGTAQYQAALESAVGTALDLLEGCRADLGVLSASEYKNALVQITRFLETLLSKCRN